MKSLQQYVFSKNQLQFLEVLAVKVLEWLVIMVIKKNWTQNTFSVFSKKFWNKLKVV